MLSLHQPMYGMESEYYHVIVVIVVFDVEGEEELFGGLMWHRRSCQCDVPHFQQSFLWPLCVAAALYLVSSPTRYSLPILPNHLLIYSQSDRKNRIGSFWSWYASCLLQNRADSAARSYLGLVWCLSYFFRDLTSLSNRPGKNWKEPHLPKQIIINQ